MKRTKTTLRSALGLLLLWLPAVAQAQPLSPQAQVSLLTAEPGGPNDELYSSFGHTAIRITDPARGMDQQFGWGTFDFRTDNFYLKFLRGTLPYWITSSDMYSFLYTYQYENRTVREQVLNLSAAQKQRLYDAILDNMRPENRTYQYKFYYDNCSTRPRDKITEACGDSLRWLPAVAQNRSYRQWMNDYLGEKPWAQLGMNLALGQPADAPANAWQAMYLPLNVYKQAAAARMRQPDGRQVPLVARDTVLFQAATTFRQQLPLVLHPAFVLGVLCVAIGVFTLRRYQRGRVDAWLDKALFGFAGLWGWIALLLWVATNHGVTAWNPTLLWLLPLHLPGVFWALRRPGRQPLYFGATAGLIVIGIFLSKVPGQADTLFALTLLIRCVVRITATRSNTALLRRSTARATT